MIDREDGPIKHYRLVCNKCKKQTKRYSYGLTFTAKEFPGWTTNGDEDEPEHYCPTCSGNPEPPKVQEIVTEAGSKGGMELSDHEEASVFLRREADGKLTIGIYGKQVIVITADTPIKVELHAK